MPQPSLTPLPPQGGPSIPLPDASVVLVGTAPESLLRLEGPAARNRHARLEHRDDGWYLVPEEGRTLLNGGMLTAAKRLRDADQIEFSDESAWEFVSGEQRTRRMQSAADMVAPPRRRYGHVPGLRRDRPAAAIGVIVASLLLFVVGIGVIWFGLFHAGRSPDVLTEQQANRFDSLLVVAYDHIERGSTLLELGLGDVAIQEFVSGVNTVALSDLRDHPQVKPRIVALEATVASIYRERQLAVPEAYAKAPAITSEEDFRAASLTRARFAEAFTRLSLDFRSRFRDTIVVVGRDHAEHVALYGKGGALDLRTRTMNRMQVGFVIQQCRALGIRVKDFSQDSILRQQIRAAIRAGLLDRAGTGLHLHIDRFANRRDRWTVSLLSPPLVTSGEI